MDILEEFSKYLESKRGDNDFWLTTMQLNYVPESVYRAIEEVFPCWLKMIEVEHKMIENEHKLHQTD